MSVTYGAGGSSRGPTAEVVHHIRHDLGVEAMPHLVCVAHTREEIAGFVDGYRADGVDNILALHGDLPEGSTEATGHFTRALDLVAFIRERGAFDVAVAAHPEGHPRARASRQITPTRRRSCARPTSASPSSSSAPSTTSALSRRWQHGASTRR
jgi:methylenetetrahydrofolate reductase (NADPH)